ncbi:MAG: KTSC domain-containing protein [Litorimonas sp.]
MLIPIQSQIIDAVSYDAQARRLYVQLKGGNAYTYEGVPAHVFRSFVGADSPGAVFNRVIKRYPARRVEDDGWSSGWSGEAFG